MSELPNPIRDVLRDGGSELGAQRVWGRLAKTLDRPARRPPVRVALALAGVTVALLATWALWPDVQAAPGPLGVAGEVLHERHLRALGEAPAELALADGSLLRSVQPARVEILENSGQVFSLFLHSGEVQFDVRPGGPRRWTIETGLVTVEVVGTRFTVARAGAGVRVSVDRGVVLVRGERVPDRVRRLEHGQSFELTPAPAAPAPEATLENTPPVSGPTKRAPRSPAKPAEEPVATAVVEGFDAGADAATREASPEELIALADVARAAGQLTEAVSALRRIVETYPDDPMAPVAAFTLGKLQLEQLRDFEGASASFERANALGLPDALREQTYARWVEALGRAGQLARCRELAEQYRARFPHARVVEVAQHCAP